jgi:hypothetical protein
MARYVDASIGRRCWYRTTLYFSHFISHLFHALCSYTSLAIHCTYTLHSYTALIPSTRTPQPYHTAPLVHHNHTILLDSYTTTIPYCSTRTPQPYHTARLVHHNYTILLHSYTTTIPYCSTRTPQPYHTAVRTTSQAHLLLL